MVFLTITCIPDLISRLTPSTAGQLKASVQSHSSGAITTAADTLRPPIELVDEARLKREAAYKMDNRMLTAKWEGIKRSTTSREK